MNPNNEQEDYQENLLVKDEEVEELKQSLPKGFFMGKLEIVQYQGYWYRSETNMLKSTLLFQRHFRARDGDLIIASFPKTGTTWLKSLLYSVVNRFSYPNMKQTPLLNHHPHELVCRLENDIYGDAFEYPRPHHLRELPSPRLFNTHLPYSSLPESIKLSGCRVLYICRNPLDTIVSMMHFAMKPIKKLFGEDVKLPSFEDYFEEFYVGNFVHGPFFEHVLEYWKQSLERSDKVLFHKYEDLKENPIVELKRIAQFVGMPFSPNEESEGVVNEKNSYFRKGEVGDWANYFTPSMVERMKKLMEEKLGDTGLSFQLLPQ